MTKKSLKPKNRNSAKVRKYNAALRKGVKSQHVVPHEKGWAVKRIGAKKATKVFDKQSSANKHAKKIADNNKASVYVHGEDGKIRKKECLKLAKELVSELEEKLV